MNIGLEKSRPCPVCRKPVEENSTFLPFCSKRCQQVDLARWATGDYRVKGDPATPWELENGDD